MPKAKTKKASEPVRKLTRGEATLKRIYTKLAEDMAEKFPLSSLPEKWDELKAFQKAQIAAELGKLPQAQVLELAVGLCARDIRQATKSSLAMVGIEGMVSSIKAAIGGSRAGVHVVRCGS